MELFAAPAAVAVLEEGNPMSDTPMNDQDSDLFGEDDFEHDEEASAEKEIDRSFLHAIDRIDKAIDANKEEIALLNSRGLLLNAARQEVVRRYAQIEALDEVLRRVFDQHGPDFALEEGQDSTADLLFDEVERRCEELRAFPERVNA